MRIQPGGFDNTKILTDLELAVRPENYDFVILYTLHEVPGWINSGPRYSYPAKNIGCPNSSVGQMLQKPEWVKLKSIPHMNSIELLDNPIPPDRLNYGSTLTVFHEIFHYWGVYIAVNNTIGPRNWQYRTHPVAYLGSASSHWTWVWEDKGMPGIMYSGATSTKFNEFDLYLMGLMNYEEAKSSNYYLYEYPRSEPPVLHNLNLDSLIYSLSLAGSRYFEGDGKRIPTVDNNAKKIKVLIVVVKGQDEIMTEQDISLIKKLAQDIPNDWAIATSGRSEMKAIVSQISTLSITPPGITVASTSGGIGNFNVTSNTNWTVTDNAAWLDLSLASSSGNRTLTVTTTSDNTTANPRNANVTFAAPGVSSVIVTVTQSSGLTDIGDVKDHEINIFPNPVSGILNIEYRDKIYNTINILNSQGTLLEKRKVILPTQQLDFSKFKYGLYILEFVNPVGKTKKVKVVNQ
jgi:hypothetical protein